MTGRVGTTARPGRRVFATFVLAAASLLALAAAGWAYFVCDLAVYHCPADGCGNVPEQNCQSAVGLFLVVTLLALLVIGGTAAWLARSRRPGPPEPGLRTS